MTEPTLTEYLQTAVTELRKSAALLLRFDAAGVPLDGPGGRQRAALADHVEAMLTERDKVGPTAGYEYEHVVFPSLAHLISTVTQ